jgi:hypothetical protein
MSFTLRRIPRQLAPAFELEIDPEAFVSFHRIFQAYIEFAQIWNILIDCEYLMRRIITVH